MARPPSPAGDADSVLIPGHLLLNATLLYAVTDPVQLCVLRDPLCGYAATKSLLWPFETDRGRGELIVQTAHFPSPHSCLTTHPPSTRDNGSSTCFSISVVSAPLRSVLVLCYRVPPSPDDVQVRTKLFPRTPFYRTHAAAIEGC